MKLQSDASAGPGKAGSMRCQCRNGSVSSIRLQESHRRASDTSVAVRKQCRGLTQSDCPWLAGHRTGTGVLLSHVGTGIAADLICYCS